MPPKDPAAQRIIDVVHDDSRAVREHHNARSVDLLLPYGIAFKLVTVLGVVSLPVGPDAKWDTRGNADRGFDRLKEMAAQRGANGLLLIKGAVTPKQAARMLSLQGVAMGRPSRISIAVSTLKRSIA